MTIKIGKRLTNAIKKRYFLFIMNKYSALVSFVICSSNILFIFTGVDFC